MHHGARKSLSNKKAKPLTKYNDKIAMTMIIIITPYIDGNDQLQLLQRSRLEYVLKKDFECQILIKSVYFNKLKQNPNETNLCYL